MTVTASNTFTGLSPGQFAEAARLFLRAGISPAEVRAAAEAWPVPFAALAEAMDTEAAWAPCGLCCQPPGEPCVTHPSGYHVARLCTAWRCGLLSAAELNTVFAFAVTFSNSTVIYADGAR